MSYKPGSVVRVPFPFVDSGQAKHRPALVLSRESFNAVHGLAVMAMITSAQHSLWPSDVPVGGLAAAGLPKPSIVRFKLFTLDLRLVAGAIGRLNAKDWKAVQAVLAGLLPPSRSVP